MPEKTLIAFVAGLLLATAGFAEPPSRPTVAAVRAVASPIVDGDLSDPAWQSAPEITGFTQHDPDEDKPETERTVVKVVYDSEAIYVGAFLHDSHPVTTRLGRRDDWVESDWFRVYLDSQHDHLSGAAFWVNPSNVQADMTLYNDIYSDWSWDAVWASETKIVPGGWVAEMRIPFSQLRFPKSDVQLWGVNFMRYIARRAEYSRFVNTRKSETGFVSHFADLTGIAGIDPRRQVEVVPYAVARSDLASRPAAGDPFARRSKSAADAGVDVKVGITSNVTFTGTINPDFGQVEVDPAVVNLSQFETFFPEKRPFFTEGAQMFVFGEGPATMRANLGIFPPQFFYSRRIGRPPQGTGEVDADWVDAPGETTILGAGKVTGKFGSGWSFGVLDAVTQRETARLDLGGVRSRAAVEPMTNYLVGRAAKEYRSGNSRVGVLFTGVNRSLTPALSFLRREAYTAGVDGFSLFGTKDWLLDWFVIGSRIAGSAESIDLAQRSPARYFDRPDAKHVRWDPTRTSLNGYGGRVMFAKQTGHWRPNLQVQGYSPGFEANDAGFMQRADILSTQAVLVYDNRNLPESRYFRMLSFWGGKYQNWNFDRDLLANAFWGRSLVQFKNYWVLWLTANKNLPALDDRKTRGGPLARRPGSSNANGSISSDSRKPLSFEIGAGAWGNDEGSHAYDVWTSVEYRPSTNLLLRLSPTYSFSYEASQYVTALEDGRRVFGKLDQRTLDFGARIDWTLTSRLSLQAYTQPLIASADYHDYSALARARSSSYVPVDYDGNPDFNFRSVRASVVGRWEFRPGSALYLVWNENRAESIGIGDFRLRRDLSSIRRAPSQDVFLVKVSYWIPR